MTTETRDPNHPASKPAEPDHPMILDGGATKMIPVMAGLFAAGRVEVTSDGLAEGTTVGMPS